MSGSGDETVRLWDMATGVVLKTLEGHLGMAKPVAFPLDSKAVNTLLVSEDWILEGGTNILWLPPDYRPICVALRDRILILGYASERISILGFKEGLKLI